MSPDWESNRQPFCALNDSQPTEPYQPGQDFFLYKDPYLNIFSILKSLKCEKKNTKMEKWTKGTRK